MTVEETTVGYVLWVNNQFIKGYKPEDRDRLASLVKGLVSAGVPARMTRRVIVESVEDRPWPETSWKLADMKKAA